MDAIYISLFLIGIFGTGGGLVITALGLLQGMLLKKWKWVKRGLLMLLGGVILLFMQFNYWDSQIIFD